MASALGFAGHPDCQRRHTDPGDKPEDEFWVDDGGATEYTCIKGERMKSTGSTLFRVAGYGRLPLVVDQKIGNFAGPTRELELEYVAHVLALGRQNFL